MTDQIYISQPTKANSYHTDQAITFVKIPHQLFSITPANARLYAVYLDFKAFNPEGVILTPFARKADRFYYHYWLKKLVARKWATKTDHGFSMQSYQYVWRSLGVEQSWNELIQRYKFNYLKIDIADLPMDRKEYIPFLTDKILNKVASNLTQQIQWRLKQKGRSLGTVNNKETFLGVRAVAKLLGLKSPSSGHKYRNLLFEVIPEPTVRRAGNKLFYQCKRIAI